MIFLAADFDEESWADDVAAFVEPSRAVGFPAAVERSRSGNGAHVSFFFAAPVAAATARRMGCYLITETMRRRHQLRMASYDRLFPNQDTLPRGGFGNLIALPLQHQARERGHTVFLDDNLEPYPDQWTYLASIRRMDRAAVEEIAGEATRRGQVLGDQRCTGTCNRFQFVGELTPTQSQAARALLEHDIGVFVGPPGIGKTVLGAYLIAKRACSTLVLVHRRPLLDQWVAQLTMFL